MAHRHVTHSGKDDDGDITRLCNPPEAWSPRSKADAIADIETNTHSYFVSGFVGEVRIRVVNGPTGKYLRTDPDKTESNNLDDLDDC